MPYWYNIAGQRLLTIFGRQPDSYATFAAHLLHPNEHAFVSQLPSANRRQAWVQGRLAIKQLIRHADPQASSPQQLEIVSRDQRELGCAPRVVVNGKVLSYRPSLSHTSNYFAACLGDNEALPPGIDLVEHGELAPMRLRFWLRADERERLDQLRDAESTRRALARLWGGKEAAFKTLPTTTPFQPQQIVIEAWDEQGSAAGWNTANRMFSGSLRWHELPELTLTLSARNA